MNQSFAVEDLDFAQLSIQPRDPEQDETILAQNTTSSSLQNVDGARVDSPVSVLHQNQAAIQQESSLLLRFVLEDLRFTYNINPRSFRDALAAGPPTLRVARLFFRSGSLINNAERQRFIMLGRKIKNACWRVKNNQHSLITNTERQGLVSTIIEPANILGIDPGYVIDHVLKMTLHGFQPELRKNTLLYEGTSMKPLFVFGLKLSSKKLARRSNAQKLIASRLVSDEVVVASLKPLIGENLQLLIARAVVNFDEVHAKCVMGRVQRRIHTSDDAFALVAELTHSMDNEPRPLYGDDLVRLDPLQQTNDVGRDELEMPRPMSVASFRSELVHDPRRTSSAMGFRVSDVAPIPGQPRRQPSRRKRYLNTILELTREE